jgi:hypothetical protein
LFFNKQKTHISFRQYWPEWFVSLASIIIVAPVIFVLDIFNSTTNLLRSTPLLAIVVNCIVVSCLIVFAVAHFKHGIDKFESIALLSVLGLTTLYFRSIADSLVFWPSISWLIFFAAFFLPYASRNIVLSIFATGLAIQMIIALLLFTFQENQFLTSSFGYRASGIMGSPNGIYPLSIISSFLFIKLASEKHTAAMKLLYIALSIASLGTLIVTFSRGAYFGFGVGIVCATFQYKRYRFISLCFCIALSMVGILLRANGNLGAFIHDKSVLSRTTIWKQSYELWMNKPLIGNGFEAFERIDNNTLVSEPKNLLLSTLIDTGIFGLILSIIIWTEIVFQSKKSMMNESITPLDRIISHTSFCSAVSLLSAGIFDTPIFSTPDRAAATVTLMVLAGMSLRIASIKSASDP